MTLRLENGTGFKNIRLPNSEQFGRSIDANAEIFAPAAIDDTVLSVLSSEGRLTIEGTTVGQQRITDGTTSKTDPTAAVAEWVADFEAWVNSTQANEGYTLRNELTDETENITPEAISWRRGAGEYQSVAWTAELELGGDIGGDLGIDPATVSPGGTDSFDDIDLPYIYDRRVDKSVQLDTIQELLADSPSDNRVVQSQGAVKRTTLLGRYEGTWSEMRAFDDKLIDRVGDGETYQFESAFPGETLEAAIGSYESTREAGITRKGDYVLELIAGSVV